MIRPPDGGLPALVSVRVVLPDVFRGGGVFAATTLDLAVSRAVLGVTAGVSTFFLPITITAAPPPPTTSTPTIAATSAMGFLRGTAADICNEGRGWGVGGVFTAVLARGLVPLTRVGAIPTAVLAS